MHFNLRVHSWILPKDHELHLSYKSSFSNVTLSKFIERLTSQYMLCKGIRLPDIRKEVNFAKHTIPKKLDYFVFQNSGLQQPLHQHEYFRSKSCKLLVLPSKNISKNCHAENIKFKCEVNFKKAVLTAPAKLNAPVKFTSPDRIKLTLQQKRLECKQLERVISNMREALDSDSKKVLNFLKIFKNYFRNVIKKRYHHF